MTLPDLLINSAVKFYGSSDSLFCGCLSGFTLQKTVATFLPMLYFKVNTFSPSKADKEANYSRMQKLNDGWLRLIGIPLVAFISTLFFYSEHWLADGFSFGFSFMTSLSISAVVWYLNRWVLLSFRERFPEIEDTVKRILLQLVASFAISAVASLIISWFYDFTQFWGKPLIWQDYVYNIFVVLIFVLLVSGIYEGNFYFARWRVSVKEAEQLKKANLQSQFESLKNQVSPHFLFNSLNTLSSLIEENPEQAVRFVNQLSRVYRYLLQSNEKELTTVKEELDFLQAYFFLLETRFGEGLKLETSLPEQYLQSLIPPLTLQILVENAVKHNVVSVSKPLHIRIFSCNEDQICVSNNLQKKTLNVASNGMGLANIAAKYRLLNKTGLDIGESGNRFQVSLPLIKN